MHTYKGKKKTDDLYDVPLSSIYITVVKQHFGSTIEPEPFDLDAAEQKGAISIKNNLGGSFSLDVIDRQQSHIYFRVRSADDFDVIVYRVKLPDQVSDVACA